MGTSQHQLAFFLAPPFTEDAVMRVLLLVQHLGKKGRWPLGRPEFFDEVDEGSATQPGDVPIRSVGGVVCVSAEEIESVERIVARLGEFSSSVGVAFEVQLDGRYVGRVVEGAADAVLTRGLLEPWRRGDG